MSPAALNRMPFPTLPDGSSMNILASPEGVTCPIIPFLLYLLQAPLLRK